MFTSHCCIFLITFPVFISPAAFRMQRFPEPAAALGTMPDDRLFPAAPIPASGPPQLQYLSKLYPRYDRSVVKYDYPPVEENMSKRFFTVRRRLMASRSTRSEDEAFGKSPRGCKFQFSSIFLYDQK